MRKHLSVLALAARGTVCKVIAVTILAALLSGALLRLVPAYEDRIVYANDDGSVTSEYYPSRARPARQPSAPWASPSCWRC